MRLSSRVVGFAIMMCCVGFGLAQEPASATGMGTVTGHVICGDTQRPARFAQVILFGVPPDVTAAPKPPDPNDMAAAMAMVKQAMGGMNMVQGQTGVDGSFALTSVAPGDYYVFTSVPGYVQPQNLVTAAFEAGVDLKKGVPGVPVLHVVADRAAQVEVTADRGAAVDGKVLWDDGGPVAHASITVESVKGKEKELPPQFTMLAMSSAMNGGIVSLTDDTGHFRVAGLAAGEYYVKVSLQTSMQFAMQGGGMNFKNLMSNTPLIIYSPSAFHKADAKAITLHSGEETRDLQVTVNLNGMHTVRGRVESAEDHHGINSGVVKLEDTKDKEFKRSGSVDAAGNFAVSFVPQGTYTMTATDAADTEPSKKKQTALVNFDSDHTLKSYQDGKQTVIVTDSDLAGQNFALTPDKKTKKDVDLNGILGGLMGAGSGDDGK